MATARFQVLVVDLDGTLTASDGTVSPRNRAAVAAARGAGIQVIVATGRSISESRRILQAIEHEGLLIAAGGSALCDVTSGATLERRVVPESIVARASRSLDAHGHRTLILKDHHQTGYDYLVVGSATLDPASDWWFAQETLELRFVEVIEDDPDPDHTLRAGAVAQGADMAAVVEALRAELGGEATLQHWSAVTESHAVGAATHLLEIFHSSVNKWTMLEWWCGRQGIDRASVVAIGDGLNDVELIEGAGLGIAMSNADPRVLAVADRVTGHHDDDGFADAVEGVLLGRRHEGTEARRHGG